MSLVDSSGDHCYSEHERLNLQVALIFLSSEINNSPEPHLFALIIGINDYMHYDKLLGAVPDARAFSDYLTTSLNVPETRIKMLIDQRATRKEIIENLINLNSLDAIAVGDPIVIFYAGHGGEALAPRVWEAGRPEFMTQMIIPQDSTNSPEIPGIPDRTIIGLLNKIAASKGNNIVRFCQNAED
jgi:hypothetical protein